MKQAEKEAEREVEELYSTKPKRVFMAGREYVIPANYFGAKQKDEPDTFHASDEGGFGFFLFLPEYGGHTKENWRDPFDPRLITIVLVRPNIRGDGKGRGDNLRGFNSLRFLMEDKPSFKLYGLQGYRRKGKADGAFWAGTRSNDEFFFFKSDLAPGEPTKPGIINPLCDVRYYSDKEDLYIVYRYSQKHIAKWREIDDAIWAKLHGWQVK